MGITFVGNPYGSGASARLCTSFVCTSKLCDKVACIEFDCSSHECSNDASKTGLDDSDEDW